VPPLERAVRAQLRVPPGVDDPGRRAEPREEAPAARAEPLGPGQRRDERPVEATRPPEVLPERWQRWRSRRVVQAGRDRIPSTPPRTIAGTDSGSGSSNRRSGR
jgi:hypothetical protein